MNNSRATKHKRGVEGKRERERERDDTRRDDVSRLMIQKSARPRYSVFSFFLFALLSSIYPYNLYFLLSLSLCIYVYQDEFIPC